MQKNLKIGHTPLHIVMDPLPRKNIPHPTLGVSTRVANWTKCIGPHGSDHTGERLCKD